MSDFILLVAGKIRGDQLVDEILQATGINLTDQYTFYPPSTVRLPESVVAGHESEIQAIVDAHVPDPLYFPADLIRLHEEEAEAQVATVPGWAHWTEAEALAWFTENIADPLDTVPDVDGLTTTQYRANAQAIDAQWQDVITAQAAAIRGLARMVLALRNKLWPNLEGSE